MGDIADANDLDRVMRSAQGQAHLKAIRNGLAGRSIVDVRFSNEVSFIATTLVLSDGETFFLTQPSLEVDALREQFHDAIERE